MRNNTGSFEYNREMKVARKRFLALSAIVDAINGEKFYKAIESRSAEARSMSVTLSKSFIQTTLILVHSEAGNPGGEVTSISDARKFKEIYLAACIKLSERYEARFSEVFYEKDIESESSLEEIKFLKKKIEYSCR